jgi:hypothetical protein
MATYTITSLQQLQDINSGHLADDCVLANDIDASATATWNQGGTGYKDQYYGFVPIGQGSMFTGTFDGGGHKITNLYINRISTNGAGTHDSIALFSDVYRNSASGFIKDLTLENVDITGGNETAGLAGTMEATVTGYLTITNVSVTGLVTCTEQEAGGLVANSDTVDFVDCSASITLTNTTNQTNTAYYGGFIGSADLGNYTDCQCVSTINFELSTSTTMRIGGFFGRLGGGAGDAATNCNCTTTITADLTMTSFLYVGGFAGSIQNSSAVSTACSVKGTIAQLATGAQCSVGGFCGNHSGTTTKCSADVDVDNYSQHATNNDAGGFIGRQAGSGSSASNCYSKGSVNLTAGLAHTDQRLGGFIGYHGGTNTLSYSYSIGQVYATGSPTNGGGFVGIKVSTPTETALFYDTETSGYTTDGGDATGKTTVQMKTESTFTGAGWDFDDVWYISTFTRTPGLSTTVWLSETGDYENFEEGVNDADSFSLGIPTQDIILWMESLEALLVGTAGDEWTIGSNKLQTPISPTNFGVKQQSTYGSTNIQAQKVNEVILFVDFVKRKIREATYDIQTEKYVSPDLTSLAEHITETGVVSMAHQKNPDSILWCVLTDGSLISMVYDRQQDVVAWSDHPIDGTVLSVCVVPGTNEDDVWLSVKRTINSVDKLYVEKMATRIQGDIEDSFFVDSGLVVTGTSATISTLSHLEGETVAALVDGVYDGTFTVSGGSITLNTTPTEQTIVGLPYTAILKPMRIVQNSQTGSSMGALTRINKLKIIFMNTQGVQYGDSASSLFTFNFDDERLEDAAYITGLFSGDIPVNMPGGFSLENPIIISSSQPLPMTVKAIVAAFEQTGR